MASSKKGKTKTSTTVWKDRYDLGTKDQAAMFKKFASWYDTMYAHINTSQYALWRSKVFLPIIPSKAWGMIAKMQSLNPGFEVARYGEALLDPESGDKAEKAQWKLEHDWDNPHFDEPMPEKLFSPLVDAVVTGTGLAKVPWCFGDHYRYEKYVDEVTGEIDFTQDVKITTGRGYNDLIPQDIMATYIAPGSKNLYSAPWVILEDWVTYEQLVDENEAAGGALYDKAALAQVKDLKSTSDKFSTEKKSRTQLVSNDDPVEQDSTVQQFKRLECYEKSTNLIYTFGVGDNGGGTDESFVELSGRKNIYWHGKYPLVPFYVKRRPHSFWGQGVFEDTERMQSAFNDLFNHYMDNLNLSLDGMIMKQEGEDFEYVVEPGAEFLYKNEKPEQFNFPEPNAVQFNSVMNFIEKQVEDATVSDYALGTPDSATDTTNGTAAGIKTLQAAAGDKIGSFRKQFSHSLREIGRQWLSNNQQFMDQDFTVMGQENNVPAPVTISPHDLQGELILRINDASMEPMTEEQKVQKEMVYQQQMKQLSIDSIGQAQASGGATQPFYVDFTALAQNLATVAGRNDFDKIIITQEDIEAQMQEQQEAEMAQMQEAGIDPGTGLPLEDLNGEMMDGAPAEIAEDSGASF